MAKNLVDAACKGDVVQLHNLIRDNPYILRAVPLSSGDTPLHLACFGGHLNFVKEILNLNPNFATQLNQDGFSPLHIASANGDLEIVKEILKIGSHVCLVKGKDKNTPLHLAVARGRTGVVSELISACLDSVTEVTARGESCLHLAVKNNQFGVFEILIEDGVLHQNEDLLNMKDKEANTILHLAAYTKQYEVFDQLLDEKFGYKDKLELNSLNKHNLSPIDVLISGRGDCEIEEMLRQAGARGNQEMNHPFPLPNSFLDESSQEQRRERPKRPSKQLEDYFKYDNIKDSPTKVRNTLLLVAALIATATYQAVLSPPGGVWQDDFQPDNINNSSSGKPPRPHTAGHAVLGTNNEVSYGLFLFFNSIGFFMSLHMMNFVTVGLPMQFELRVSIVALIATYDTCMIAITPSKKIYVMFTILSILMPIMMPILTNVVRDFMKGRRGAVACVREGV